MYICIEREREREREIIKNKIRKRLWDDGAQNDAQIKTRMTRTKYRQQQNKM
jgi:hypothetical protein